DDYRRLIENGAVTPLTVIINSLRSKDLRPYETNLDPCTGSVVVENVNTGETLALVTYPSYDNNLFVNSFDSEYYYKLLNDPTTPLVNRPLKQTKAPGSTFKMVSAIAGLETGVITPYSLIVDESTFTKAGRPHARCWTVSTGSASHGPINVSTALEVSCNYFFYETAFRMGNAENETSTDAIAALSKWAEAFGLGDYTGIEIGEYAPNIATPEYKEDITKRMNPDATTSQTRWTDGDTIRAAIGQSVNNFAPAHMTKYVATLANGGTRYTMHLIDRVETSDGIVTEQKEPVIETQLDIKQENLNAVYRGMLAVTQGERGTLRNVFRNFPVDVAAKSGTAQENLSRSSHTWFVCYAPYDDPQIAVTVMIPFGENTSSPAAVVAREVIAEYMGLNYKAENGYMNNNLAQ
ncbi:MAG: peptidoglycan glycosyltransferase, partial [Firmicutes bacterium]|nr:peptidoglycan glycosyltransferase [Bacillota bacterium]